MRRTSRRSMMGSHVANTLTRPNRKPTRSPGEAGCRGVAGSRWCAVGSAAVEHPDVVLVVRGAPKLFDGSKTAATIEQLVPKLDGHLAVRTTNPPAVNQNVTVPAEARHRLVGLPAGADFAPIRLQLEFDLERSAPAQEGRFVFEPRL